MAAVVYFFSAIQAETWHSFSHHESLVEHKAEDEKDPCHRAVFHHAVSDGCEHKTHISKRVDCDLCHIICIHADSLITESNIVLKFFPEGAFTRYHLESINAPSAPFAARGPPAS